MRPTVWRLKAIVASAVAGLLAACGVNATEPQAGRGFATSLRSGAPQGLAHAFVMAESPPAAFAFRPAAPGDSRRPVIVHYFPPYPLTLGGHDPENDYYARNYLRPEGEKGKFAAWGGLLRERPLPGPRSPRQAQSDFRVEVARAARIGVDVFAVDLLKLEGRPADAVAGLLDAAQETDPRFRIAITPDMNGLRAVTLDQLVAYLLDFAKHPAAFRAADGKLVVMPFRTEARPPEFWKALIERMENRSPSCRPSWLRPAPAPMRRFLPPPRAGLPAAPTPDRPSGHLVATRWRMAFPHGSPPPRRRIFAPSTGWHQRRRAANPSPRRSGRASIAARAACIS
jgi:hypothetical protein